MTKQVLEPQSETRSWLEMPLRRLRHVLRRVSARVQLRDAHRGRGVMVWGPLELERADHIHVGPNSVFLSHVLRSHLGCGPEGHLTIGEGTIFNHGVHLHAERDIRIGNNCMFASRVRLVDRDGERVAPIVIEDDVWLAHGVTVMPGVTVGRGSVVAAGSLVVRDVPPGSLAIGRPARAMSLDLAAPA